MRTGATYIALVRGYAPGWVRLSGGLVERYPLRLPHPKILLGKVSQNQLTGSPQGTDKSALSGFQRGSTVSCRMRGATSRPFGWHVLRHIVPGAEVGGGQLPRKRKRRGTIVMDISLQFQFYQNVCSTSIKCFKSTSFQNGRRKTSAFPHVKLRISFSSNERPSGESSCFTFPVLVYVTSSRIICPYWSDGLYRDLSLK